MASLIFNPHLGQQFHVSQSSVGSLPRQSWPHCGHFVSGVGVNIRASIPPMKKIANPNARTPPNMISSRFMGFCMNHIPRPTRTPAIKDAPRLQLRRPLCRMAISFWCATSLASCGSVFGALMLHDYGSGSSGLKNCDLCGGRDANSLMCVELFRITASADFCGFNRDSESMAESLRLANCCVTSIQPVESSPS